jgi:hypothetical protein
MSSYPDTIRAPLEGNPQVLIMGRIDDSEIKGLDIAANAIAFAAGQRASIDPEITMLVLGAPPYESGELRKRILGWTRSLRPVVRPYTTDASQLDLEFRRTALVLMPSRAEAFGLVGLESIVAGTPVLVSGNSGLGMLLNTVVPEEAASVVCPVTGDMKRDAPAWGSAILTVLRSPREALARAADLREKMAARRTWAMAAEQLLRAAAIDAGSGPAPGTVIYGKSANHTKRTRAGGVPDTPSLSRLRSISEAAVNDCDVVGARGTDAVIRLSRGAYVARTIEPRLLRHLQQPSVTAVVGEAGYGKTALLWRLHQKLAADRLPLFIPASALIADPGSAPDLTTEAIGQGLREAQQASAPVTLLIDTLDLLLHDRDSTAQVNRLLAVASRYRVPVAVTVRPVEAQLLEIAYEEPQVPEDRIRGIPLYGYDRTERPAAVRAYAAAFYPAERVAEVVQVVEVASVRGLPLQEVCQNPLALRLLFELYAPEDVPPEDIDTIGLYEQYWRRRIERDDRSAQGLPVGEDLSGLAEAVALSLAADGVIETKRNRLAERVHALVLPDRQRAGQDLDALRARGILLTPPNSTRMRFFHQTFFEHAAARAVARAGEACVQALMNRVAEDPLDLFYGEVAAQTLLLAHRGGAVVVEHAADILEGWLAATDTNLRALALRTYARIPAPGPRLQAEAVRSLSAGDLEAVKGYLSLLPSVTFGGFDRVGADLGVLWEQAHQMQGAPDTARAGRQLALSVLAALVRIAAAYPDESIRFITEHECLDWLANQPAAEWRHHDSLYLRLLEVLAEREPGWCAAQVVRFFEPLAEAGNVRGMAEILGLLNQIAEQYALADAILDHVVSAVRTVKTDTNAAQMEFAYAQLRAGMLSALTAAELAERTSAMLGNTDWGTAGRRAELRALIRVALNLNRAAAPRYLDVLLREKDRTRQEHLCVVVGDALSGPEEDARPLVRYGRELCRRHLGRLPAARRPDGARPVPLIFVSALYGARVEGGALLAALPPSVSEELWLDADGLLPLLVPAALAGHPQAAPALNTFVTQGADSVTPGPSTSKAVLGRLQESSSAGSPIAIDFLLRYAETTERTAELAGMLSKLPATSAGLRLEFHGRLRRLRAALTTSHDRGKIQRGYVLWRLLLERGIDQPPSPSQLADILGSSAGAQLVIATLRIALACSASWSAEDWTAEDTSRLVDLLAARIEAGQAVRWRLSHTAMADRDRAAEIAMTEEGLARPTLIAVKARHLPLPADARDRRVFAEEAFALIWNANYDFTRQSDLAAFGACFREIGALLERLNDHGTVIDLILDAAQRLQVMQPDATHWRERSARAWQGALTTAVMRATTMERRQLIGGLLPTDRDMARLAIAACVDCVRPIPDWLRELQPAMDPQTQERLRAALRRQARDGSKRDLAELYEIRLADAIELGSGHGH